MTPQRGRGGGPALLIACDCVLFSEGEAMSILGRMLFLLCLFLLATMSIVGGFAYFNYRENCRLGELGVQRAALGVANYAQLFLHAAENSVKQLARAPEIVNAVGSLPKNMTQGTPLVYMEPLPPEAAALRTLLDITLYGSHRIQQAGFLDIYGGFMTSPSLRVVLVNDPRTRPWYTRALSAPAGSVVRTSYLSAPGNEPVCTFSQAVYRDGRPVGVVYMEVSLRILSQSLAVLNPGSSGKIYVLDDSGMALVAPFSRDVSSRPASVAIPQDLLGAGDGSYYSSVGGAPTFWAVHTDKLGFRYIVTLDAGELLHDSNMLLLRSCIGAGLVLLIILVAGYAIAGSAVMPLARLETSANAIADGRPDAVFPEASEFAGEIRALRNAIVRMLVALRASAAAAQRTAQRATANERYALAALRDAVRRQRDCQNTLEALRLAARDLSAAVEGLSAAKSEEERAACLKKGLKASQLFLILSASDMRKENPDGKDASAPANTDPKT